MLARLNTSVLRRGGALAAATFLVASGAVGCARAREQAGAPSTSSPTSPTSTTSTTVIAGAGGSTPATTTPSTSSRSTPTASGGTPPSAVTTAAAAGYPSAVVDRTVDDPRFDALGREIERRDRAAGVPGASLLVLHDGELVEQEAFGAYTLDTVVPIASASKWMSGVVIMSLVDEGKIALDAPISTYLTDVTGPSAAITMRQLLSFTSGLQFDEKIPCFSDRTVTLADCNKTILALPLLGAPGTGYRYTGTHLHVAAGVAEAVTGSLWDDLVEQRLLKPLHMDDTSFRRLAAAGDAPDGHPNPAGGARATLGDYGRFLEMLVHDGVAPDGTRIISPTAIAEMGTDQIADADYVSASRPRKQAKTPYGLAHWLDRTDDRGHAVVESSPGAFGFRPWIDHQNHIAGVHLVVDMKSENDTGEGDASGSFVMEQSAQALGGVYPPGRG